MNFINDEIRAINAYFEGEYLCVVLEDGRIISVPWKIFPRLANATEEQRDHFELGRFGIHWPELDEDISFAGLLSPRIYVAPGAAKYKPFAFLMLSHRGYRGNCEYEKENRFFAERFWRLTKTFFMKVKPSTN